MLLLILALWLETHSPTPLAAISAAEHSVLDAVGTKEKTIVATPATPSQHQETRATWQKNAIQPTRPIEPESASEFLWPNTRKTPPTNVRAPKPALRGPPPAESTQTNATPVIYAIIELDSPVAPNRGPTFGQATSNNYKATFFGTHPHLEGKVVVHHAVEQQVLSKFPGVVTPTEIHSLENLRGIPKAINADIHLSQIRVEWNRFYRPFIQSGTQPTKAQLLQKAAEIDAKFGSQFLPTLGGGQ